MDSISQIIKRLPILDAGDTIRRASSLLRESTASRLFVHRGGQLYGSVTERAIAAALSAADDPEAMLDRPIESLIEPRLEVLDSGAGLVRAAQVFASISDDVLPVIDGFGAYYGVVYRRDVVGVLTKNLRPPSVGGMATPLGVFLTTGSVTGGAGNLGLFLTGVSLGLMLALANVIVYGIQQAITALTGFPVAAYLASPAIVTHPNIYDIPTYLTAIAATVIFLLLMRLSPLSGFHAAEHMTVHAIEHGEVLSPDKVRVMPRVHPRCGTNLLAGVGVFLIIVSTFSSEAAIVLAMAVVIVGWRTVGGWLQYFVTTKTPSERQLRSGIAAGAQVLERYQACPSYQAVGFRRILNTGFLQTLTGLALTTTVTVYLFAWLGLPFP